MHRCQNSRSLKHHYWSHARDQREHISDVHQIFRFADGESIATKWVSHLQVKQRKGTYNSNNSSMTSHLRNYSLSHWYGSVHLGLILAKLPGGHSKGGVMNSALSGISSAKGLQWSSSSMRSERSTGKRGRHFLIRQGWGRLLSLFPMRTSWL